jgi:hypothetical protein
VEGGYIDLTAMHVQVQYQGKSPTEQWVKNLTEVDVYKLYKHEYRILKPGEVNIKRGLRKKREKWRGWTNSGYSTHIHGSVIIKLSV